MRIVQVALIACVVFTTACSKSIDEQKIEIKQLIDAGQSPELIEYLIDNELDSSLEITNGQTVLAYAFSAGSEKLVTSLVESDRVLNNPGQTIVNLAIMHNRPDIIGLVFERRLSVADKSIDMANHTGLRNAIKHDYPELISALLDAEFSFSDLYAGLELSIDSKADKTLRTLLSVPFAGKSEPALSLYTRPRVKALFHAMDVADRDILKTVNSVLRKQFIKILKTLGTDSRQGFCEAMEHGDPSIYLIADYDLRTRCENSEEVIIRVARVPKDNSADIIRLLRYKDAEIDKAAVFSEVSAPDELDELFRTPLMFAAGAANYGAVKGLIDAGVDIRAKNNADYSAIDIAIRSRTDPNTDPSGRFRQEIIRELLDSGATVNSQVMLRNIASIPYPLVLDVVESAVDYRPGTPFKMGTYETTSALNAFLEQCTQTTEDSNQIVAGLLGLGEDPNLQLYFERVPGWLRQSPLATANENGLPEIAGLLADNGAKSWREVYSE